MTDSACPAPGGPRRRQVVGSLGALPLAACWPASAPAAAPAASTDLAALLSARLQHQGVGLVAAQIDPRGLRFGAAGSRRAEGGPAPDADTLFETGSITKTFVALLLADMAQRRELALDDAVDSVLPDGLKLRDNAGAPLRFIDLATHRSGLPRLPSNIVPTQPADPYADYGSALLHAFIADWRATRARDASYDYSNLGAGLLGHALALRAGQPFEPLLRTRILAPLGLEGMVLAMPGSAVGALAPGHDAQRRPVPPWHFDVLAGAGALRGSARHLARYAQAALGLIDTPLAEAFKATLTPHGAGPGPHNPVGLAWVLGPLNGRRIAHHDGGTYGFSSSLFLDPQRQQASVVLANAMVPVTDLALHLLDASVPLRDLGTEAQVTSAEAMTLEAAALSALAGSYALSPQFKLRLRADGQRLFAQATGQGEFELFARSPRVFFARVTPLTVHFDGEPGAPKQLTLHQGGQQLRFVRE